MKNGEKKFPKVLIIGHSFHARTKGGNVALNNLFNGWPKNKLAVVSSEINEDWDRCDLQYKLGIDERKKNILFQWIQVKDKSEIITSDNIIKRENNKLVSYDKPTKKLMIAIKRIVKNSLRFLGLLYLIEKITISKKFKYFLKDFKPDIIYTRLNQSRSLMNFVYSINKEFDIPFIIHIMDDWLRTHYKDGILGFYWNKRLNKEFEKLVQKSSGNLSICRAMSEEYFKRYNKIFIPFYNPIDVEKWKSYTKKDWQIKNESKILYAGSVGKAKKKVFVDIIKAINLLNRDGYKIKFHMYIPKEKHKEIKNNNNVIFHNWVDNSEMPQIIKNFDLLIIPQDFTKNAVEYAKFSLSTKVSEFMISGVPTIVYSSKKTSLYKYSNNRNIALCIGEKGIKNIQDGIRKLLDDKELRERLGRRAHKLAIQNHSARIIRERFRKILLKSSKQK